MLAVRDNAQCSDRAKRRPREREREEGERKKRLECYAAAGHKTDEARIKAAYTCLSIAIDNAGIPFHRKTARTGALPAVPVSILPFSSPSLSRSLAFLLS